MITEKEIHILKKSIVLIHDFKDNVHNINSGQEFINIHERNLETIRKITYERNSKYLVTKLDQYPKVNIAHINEYIKINRNEVSLFVFSLGYNFTFIERFIKTKCLFSSQINSKILKITDINKKIWEVIENPYLENLYH